jgi:hypothetical protein
MIICTMLMLIFAGVVSGLALLGYHAGGDAHSRTV